MEEWDRATMGVYWATSEPRKQGVTNIGVAMYCCYLRACCRSRRGNEENFLLHVDHPRRTSGASGWKRSILIGKALFRIPHVVRVFSVVLLDQSAKRSNYGMLVVLIQNTVACKNFGRSFQRVDSIIGMYLSAVSYLNDFLLLLGDIFLNLFLGKRSKALYGLLPCL